MIKAPGTGGSLEVRRPTVWQMIPPLGMEALLPSVDASTTHYAASQTSRVTMMPGLKHLQFTQKVLESPSVETTGQRTEGDVGGDKERGQRDDLASESPCAHPHVQTLSTSRSSELELDIMNVYETQSERSGYNKSNSPGSPSSQYGCLLANEEDYVVEDESDWEEDNWDECGVSSSEE